VINRLNEEGRVQERRRLIGALGVNLVLNAGWSWLFFRYHRPWVAAAECAVLTVSSADLVRRVGSVDHRPSRWRPTPRGAGSRPLLSSRLRAATRSTGAEPSAGVAG
jgi:benzodiazapine receptor